MRVLSTGFYSDLHLWSSFIPGPARIDLQLQNSGVNRIRRIPFGRWQHKMRREVRVGSVHHPLNAKWCKGCR